MHLVKDNIFIEVSKYRMAFTGVVFSLFKYTRKEWIKCLSFWPAMAELGIKIFHRNPQNKRVFTQTRTRQNSYREISESFLRRKQSGESCEEEMI